MLKNYSLYRSRTRIFAPLPVISGSNREVPEWLKGLAWKAGIRETVSRVRIPSSLLFYSFHFYIQPAKIQFRVNTHSRKVLTFSNILLHSPYSWCIVTLFAATGPNLCWNWFITFTVLIWYQQASHCGVFLLIIAQINLVDLKIPVPFSWHGTIRIYFYRAYSIRGFYSACKYKGIDLLQCQFPEFFFFLFCGHRTFS